MNVHTMLFNSSILVGIRRSSAFSLSKAVQRLLLLTSTGHLVETKAQGALMTIASLTSDETTGEETKGGIMDQWVDRGTCCIALDFINKR